MLFNDLTVIAEYVAACAFPASNCNLSKNNVQKMLQSHLSCRYTAPSSALRWITRYYLSHSSQPISVKWIICGKTIVHCLELCSQWGAVLRDAPEVTTVAGLGRRVPGVQLVGNNGPNPVTVGGHISDIGRWDRFFTWSNPTVFLQVCHLSQ